MLFFFFLSLAVLLSRVTCDSYLRMAIVTGHVTAATPSVTPSMSWQECVQYCLTTPNCGLVEKVTDEVCNVYNFGAVETVQIDDPSSGNRVALKVNQAQPECYENLADLLNKDNVFVDFRSPEGGYLYIDLGGGYYLFKNAPLQKKTVTTMTTSEPPSCSSEDAFTVTDVPGCYMFILERGDYDFATTRCKALGGDFLMPIPDESAADYMYAAWNSVFYERDGDAHVGVRRTDGHWDWTFPIIVKDDTGFVWSRGHPKATGDCAYMHMYNSGDSPYLLQSHDCSEAVDAFICHFPLEPYSV